MLKLNATHAAAADNTSSSISEPGKYIVTITRAEALTSQAKGTRGLGLSVRTDAGQTADYLDIYYAKADGEELSGIRTVNAILCCAKVREAAEGTVQVEKWDAVARARRKMAVTGYPALMGKRIGLLLRKTLETDGSGKDRARMDIFGVFDPDTELTASEILARVTEPQKLAVMLDAMIARGVIDKREQRQQRPAAAQRQNITSTGFDGMDDDCPF